MSSVMFLVSYVFLYLIFNIASENVDKIILPETQNDVLTLPLIPHETVKRRRRRFLRESTNAEYKRPDVYARRDLSLVPSNQHITSLYQGYGTHYIDLWVGTPNPQRQTVIVDTGSHLTAFPCSECRDCGESYHTDPLYDEGSSVSFQKLACKDCSLGRCKNDQCFLGLSYKEGSSWAAYEARDILYAGGDASQTFAQDQLSSSREKQKRQASELSFEMKFGCQTALTGLFRTQLEDGILGMSDEKGSFWRQMHEANVITKKQFSLCFSHQPVGNSKGEILAGAITLGGRDERLSNMPLVYAKHYKMNGFYTIRLRNIIFWDDKDNNNGIIATNELMKKNIVKFDLTEDVLNTGGVIVDSGTTDTYLNIILRETFYNAWEKLTGTQYHNNEITLTKEEFDAFPTILFQIEGDEHGNKALGNKPNQIPGLVGDLDKEHPYDILVAMPAANFMEYDPSRKMYTARVLVNEPGTSVLGANFMMGHDVLFDVDNSRLGFTESDCDSAYLFTG